MPDAVSERPPRYGPTSLYFIPLKFGSSFAAGSEVSGLAVVCVVGSAPFFSGEFFCATRDIEQHRQRAIETSARPTGRIRVIMSSCSPQGKMDRAILNLCEVRRKEWSCVSKGFHKSADSGTRRRLGGNARQSR